MMTSSNGNIFHVTGHLCGEFTGEFPSQSPVTRSFDVFFDLRLNTRLSKQWWGWWFETPLRSLWRHHNESMRCLPAGTLRRSQNRKCLSMYWPSSLWTGLPLHKTGHSSEPDRWLVVCADVHVLWAILYTLRRGSVAAPPTGQISHMHWKICPTRQQRIHKGAYTQVFPTSTKIQFPGHIRKNVTVLGHQ